jgi:tRNA-specific 2-thiouridylase
MQEESSGGCCSLETIEDAKRVAAKLKIRHLVVPMQDVFRETVIEDFINEYKQGRTPNPCVRCNEFVKFDALLNWAHTVGAETIATGHYARVSRDEQTGRWLLLRGASKAKDQSYALYRLTQEQLSKTLFPVGDRSKPEIRQKAAELGLLVADKPDSQEICFVPDKDYPGFLSKVAPELVQPGPIVDISGKKLGEHKGIAFYTIGQRKRLGIATGKPTYVVRLDHRTNTVVVGSNADLFGSELIAENINLISLQSLPATLAVTAKIRYNATNSAATVRPLGPDRAQVVFDEPQRAITPGQAVVWYDGETVIGGGIISCQEEPCSQD